MVTHSRRLASPDAAAWLGQLEASHGTEKTDPVRQALDYLRAHSDGLTSETGVPLFQHALGCAQQLAGMDFDPETLAAALLCSLPEADLQPDRIRPLLGENVTRLTRGVVSLARMDQLLAESAGDGHDQSEALRQMLLAMTDDIRVVLVKLAERVQTLRELAKGDAELRQKVAVDARECYAPLANRLGVWQFKWELEDLICRYLEPDTYRDIAKRLD